MAHPETPDLVLRQAQDEVLRNTEFPVDLMVSLSNHEVVALSEADHGSA
jgi:hypothetical protein